MNSQANNYYLKAKENYPWDLSEVLEALEYAISYDEYHAPAHSLLGQLYAEQLHDYNRAFHHFEQALINDINYVDTYYHFSSALIQFGELERAKKLLKHAEKIKGICKSCIFEKKALVHELEGNYQKSEKFIKKSIELSIHNNKIEELNENLKRIKKKRKKLQSK